MMKNSQAVNPMERYDSYHFSWGYKASIESPNPMLVVLHKPVIADGVVTLNAPYGCPPNGLVLGNSGGGWEFVRIDRLVSERIKVLASLRKATDVLANFCVLRKLSKSLNLPGANLTERSPDAPHWAAETFCQLRRQRLAGSLSALTMLGRRCVATDWALDQIYLLQLNLTENRGDIRLSATDYDFLAAYVHYRIWARGNIREPVMAAARRAMQFVANKRSLNRGWYEINVTTL